MVAIDDNAFEPVLADHALELRDRGRRIADRQRRQAEEPRRMAPDRFRERGVRLRAKVFASSTSSCSTPGAVSDSACTSTPAASIAATRPSPMSRRSARAPQTCRRPFGPLLQPAGPGPSRKAGVAKCSSRAIGAHGRFLEGGEDGRRGCARSRTASWRREAATRRGERESIDNIGDPAQALWRAYGRQR